ncbi:MAG: HAD hydrolase family protein [Clostridia bacterium]|nr:HAD hydrolase family protein [Clostridia bacterium]
MGRFSGILLASDYDGTLAARDGTIPERERQAIRMFIAEGGRFTVSTGRTLLGFHAYDPDLINAPAILANGGMIYDYSSREITELLGLDETCIPDLRKVSGRFPELAIEMYAPDDTCCIHLNERSRRHFEGHRIVPREIEDPAEASFPCAKVMLGGSAEDIAAAQEFLAGCPSLSFVPTKGTLLEVLRPGVNKGTTLLRLAEHLGIAPGNVYAVGDGDNDADMLKAAAAAFVPANGDEAAKACASCMVCSNDDGAVADAVGIIGTMRK